MNVQYFLLLTLSVTNATFTMEQDNNNDPRNNGDISFWCSPYRDYTHAKEFIGKSAKEVDTILGKLIVHDDAPTHKVKQIQKLREAISKYAKHESFESINGNDLIYVTCAYDKAVEFKANLENVNLIHIVHKYDLNELDHDAQAIDILRQEQEEQNEIAQLEAQRKKEFEDEKQAACNAIFAVVTGIAIVSFFTYAT